MMKELSTSQLAELCTSLRGQHMTRLGRIACHGAWSVVDEHGMLTGSIADSGGRLVDWENGTLTERNGHACEAICLS